MKEITERSWFCALSGHRFLPENFDENRLYDKLEELLRLNCGGFLCGMAQGFDLTAMKCLVSLKEKYRFTIEACIPFEGQELRFSSADRKLYASMTEWCDKRTVIGETYRKGCYLQRNRYMVDHADALLAYCTKKTGGTAYTIAYAMEKYVPLILIS